MITNWQEFIQKESSQKYFIDLQLFLEDECKNHPVYPEKKNIYSAFTLTPFTSIKAVIVGQDPYHNPGQAHGLAFSVPPEVAKPPSLKNIYKEIEQDLGVQMPESGLLNGWARQGVFLLNAVLTVRGSQAGSHAAKGWETFTDKAIACINNSDEPVVFLLWGNYARKKQELISNPAHLILEAAHPSPLSAHRGFFGCRHFSKTNSFLKQNKRPEIDWAAVGL